MTHVNVRRGPLWLHVLLLLVLSPLLSPTALARAKEPEPGGARIVGKILKADGQHGARAVVHAIHLESGKVLHSEPSAADGSYDLRGLPYGYYEFAIDADGTLHAVLQPVNLPPETKMSLDFVLSDAPSPQEGAEAGLPIPGFDRRATGTAEVQGLDRVPFLKSKAGIATLVGGSVLLLVLVI